MTGRRLFRVLRWSALAAVAPALWACNARSLETPTLKQDRTYVNTFQQSINRDVDLLFMVDDSSSMKLSQTNLLNNFPTFMTTLQSAPQGLPNIHVAVVSSDMGAGDGSLTGGGCDGTGGDNGIFLSGAPRGTGAYAPTAPCATTGLDPGASFISNIAGQANYTGKLEDVFSCIAALGDQGCGFEHQFASVLRALGADGSPPPDENQGFLRPEAYLVVVFITNEDDCSAVPGVRLFDTTANVDMGSQLGPPINFRCNEFGHLCSMGGGPPTMSPSRNAPGLNVNATVTYDACTSNDDGGYLLAVKQTAERLKKLKGNPDQVVVAAITGAPAPYNVHWRAPSNPDTSCNTSGQSCPWPEISHSCGTDQTAHADPAVRVAQLVTDFGPNGLLLSICDETFAPALTRIGQLINVKLRPACITQAVANKAGTSDPDCTVVSHTAKPTGGTVDAPVPYCGSSGAAAPCWRLIPSTDQTTCTGQIVDVSAAPAVSTDTALDATVNCALVGP